jgi:phage anti-repressor protein
MELIEITYRNDEPVVSARELHRALRISTLFRVWIKRMFDYGFVDGVDYKVNIFDTPSGQHSKDYALTIDCAKHISMIQRSEIGMKVRQYFIDYEKSKVPSIQKRSPAETALALAQALVNHERRLDKLEAQITTRPEWYTIAGYATLIKQRVNITKAAAFGRKATALCKQRGIETETTHDPRFGKVKTYPVEILKEIFTV